MNINIISGYLKFLRKSHNYTQDDLAKILDILRQVGGIIRLNYSNLADTNCGKHE